MQINRLFEIVYLLLDRQCITAGELASHFEVSIRTIYRDVETLSMAGIPLYAERGKNGGIRLMENYVLNKSVLSEKESGEILAALNGLAQTKAGDYTALHKLSAFFGQQKSVQSNWVSIDFSDWSNKKQEFIEMLKDSILNRKVIHFIYYNSAGEKTKRRIYPLQLWFKGKAWYLKAYCLDRQDMRTFRLTRMRDVILTGETFDDTAILKKEAADENTVLTSEIFQEELVLKEAEEKSVGMVNKARIPLSFTLLIRKEMAYRVYDEFDESEIEETKQGEYLIHASYPLDSWVYGTILSYGDKAKVLEPDSLRREIAALGEKIRKVNTENE